MVFGGTQIVEAVDLLEDGGLGLTAWLAKPVARDLRPCGSIRTSVGRYWMIHLCRVDLPTPMSAATR